MPGSLGTMAKAAIAATALLVALVAAAGAAGVLPLPGGASDAKRDATVAAGAIGSADVPELPADAGPVTGAPAETPIATAPTLPESLPVAPVVSAPSRTGQTTPPATSSAAGVTAPTQPRSAPAPATPSGAARRTPPAAEVQQAIKTLPQYIKTIVPPTPALVAEIGNQVCTAFDQGHTFAEVKTTGLQMLTQLPRTTVLPGGADWAVRTVVTLYCPGHTSKLV